MSRGRKGRSAIRPARSSAPKWLVDGVARRLWKSLHDDLTAARFLATTDQAALGRYCQYMADWIALTEQIRREGWTYTTSSDHVEEMKRPNPAVRFRREAETALSSLEDRLGLNPRYRHAITAALLATSVAPRTLDLLSDEEAAPGRMAAPDVAAEWESILTPTERAH
jgi:P27 family predicted phage terminase small subunit